MCLAKAYPNTGMSEPIFENITYIELDGQRIRMQTMFGEEKIIPGRVLEVDFENSRVIVDLYNTSTVPDKP
jgi:predicted RNA-binding protein